MMMTYKLDPSLGKIESTVVLVFPGGERKRYQNGAAVAEDSFDYKFVVKTLRAVGDMVEIILCEQEMKMSTWIGEEQTFF